MYCWSSDGEAYQGYLESRDEAVSEAFGETEHDYHTGESFSVWTAVVVPRSIGDMVNGYTAVWLLDKLRDNAVSHAGDASKNWLTLADYPGYWHKHPSEHKVQIQLLQNKLVAALEQWASETGNQPTFYDVRDVQEHIVTVPDEEVP